MNFSLEMSSFLTSSEGKLSSLVFAKLDFYRFSYETWSVATLRLVLFVCLFSIYFEWACQDFELLKANLGPLCMPRPGMGPLV